MNENNVNIYPEDTGQQLTSTFGSTGTVTDSVESQFGTFTVVSNENVLAKADSLANAQWLNLGIFVVILAFIFIWYKQVASLKSCIQELRKKVEEQIKDIDGQKRTVEKLRESLDKIEQNYETKSTPKVQVSVRNTRKESERKSAYSGMKSTESETSMQSTRIVRYATLQAPDANGTLRFAERSMTDEITDQKLFEVELDTATGTGLYRINQAAKTILLNDLQQLHDFVEPFTINGNTPAQRIIDDKPGKIHQDGKFWIVDELAKIKIV